jgi:hypothetical protein
VLSKINYLTYKIQKSESVKAIVVHVDHLKPFEGKNLPHNWVKQTTSSGLEGKSISTDITNDSENTCLFSQNNDLPASPKTIPFVPRSRRERIIKPREISSQKIYSVNKKVKKNTHKSKMIFFTLNVMK